MSQKIVSMILILGLGGGGCVQKITGQSLAAPPPAEILETPPAVLAEALPFTAGMSCKLRDENLAQSSCGKGQLCVADEGRIDQGRCMIECGQVVDDRLMKNHDKCPAGWRCMAKKNAFLNIIGYFCAQPQTLRDQPCEAPLDEDACTESRTCMSTITSKIEGKRVFARARCKEECSNDSQCLRDGESCLEPKYARSEVQRMPNSSTRLECSIKACQTAEGECSCDKSNGFACGPNPATRGANTGFCLRPLGVCGIATPLAKPSDFRGNSFFGKTCNEITDNRFCQIFDNESKDSATTLCTPLSSNGKEGACIALCSRPTFEEKGMNHKLACPAHFSCQENVARKLGLYSYMEKQNEPKPCTFSKCQPNVPCPQECGSKTAECLEKVIKGKKGYYCGAPYGLCEPDPQ